MSTTSRIERGDGIGIELTHDLLRGVRLARSNPGVPVAAAEIPVRDIANDRMLLDALTRLRAELGGFASVPARLAMFPAGTTMRRVDVTGLSGPELNVARAELERRNGIVSSVLADDGPRRWMFAVDWDASRLRRVEELAERAGLLDVAIDPSPIALARVLEYDVTIAERVATTGEAFVVALDSSFPVAAASIDSIGVTPPHLALSDSLISIGMFDDVIEPGDVAGELSKHRPVAGGGADSHALAANELVIGDVEYPPFPEHDLRAPERQCVAIGAAVGAAGLAGRLRPVDVVTALPGDGTADRPWAIERVSTLPEAEPSAGPGAVQRLTSRFRPRRR